jgi:hypothetical protein
VGDVANLTPVRPGESSPALKHGSYSLIQLAPRARQLAEELARLLPIRSEAFAPTIDLAATALARCEFAAIALAHAERAQIQRLTSDRPLRKPERDELERLSRDLSRWSNNAARLLDTLGLNPRSAAALGVDLARGRGEALRAHLAEKYAAENGT